MYQPEERRGEGAPVRSVRCAIYCRKSTEEGLELAFNSLDAQRDACASYIASQKHEGWVMLPEIYDDGGFSGGTMERPALKELLKAVQAREVDVVVVYKVDRLTRSLSDFARIVDVLDAAKASFVSVTQSFSTVTSMGRLTLNMLLSFAQYERELGSERVRDKIAASKKRGIWMGGVVPLGYAARDRKLVIVEHEAASVRLIFERYLELGSVAAVEVELPKRGIRSRSRMGRDGQELGDRPLITSHIHAILKNPIYAGKICHQGTAYPGEHEAIIDEETFVRVQALLAQHQAEDRHGKHYAEPSALTGLLWDEHGRRMVPSHATKQARRYRYYKTAVGASQGSAPKWRLPAADLEGLVADRICAFLLDQTAIYEAVEADRLAAEDLNAILFAAMRLAGPLADSAGHARRTLFLQLVERVEVATGSVAITLKTHALWQAAGGDTAAAARCEPVVLVTPAQLVRAGREVRLAIAGRHEQSLPERDPPLIKLLVKAHAAREALLAGRGASMRELAERLGYDTEYLPVLVKLAYLAPDITTAILGGRQLKGLTRQVLARVRALPMDWAEQRRVLGMS